MGPQHVVGRTGGQAGALGEPVADGHADLGVGQGGAADLLQFRRPDRAAAADAGHRRRVVVAQPRMLDQPPELGGDPAPAGDAVLLGEPQDLLGVVAVGGPDVVEAGADGHHRAGVQARDVEQRAASQGRAARLHRLAREAQELTAADQERAGQVGEEVAVGLHRAPGPAGGAGREQDGGRVVDVDLAVRQRPTLVGVDQAVNGIGAVGTGVHEDHRHAGVAVETLQAAAVGDQHLGLGEVEAVADLVALPPAVHGHRDRSGTHRPPEPLDPARLVGAEQTHPVARSDPVAFGQPCGHRRRVGDVLVEGGAAAVVEQVVAGRAVAAVVGRRGQQIAHAAVGAGDHPHIEAADVLGDDLEEPARTGEHGVGLGDRHRGLLIRLRLLVVPLLVHHLRDNNGANDSGAGRRGLTTRSQATDRGGARGYDAAASRYCEA